MHADSVGDPNALQRCPIYGVMSAQMPCTFVVLRLHEVRELPPSSLWAWASELCDPIRSSLSGVIEAAQPSAGFHDYSAHDNPFLACMLEHWPPCTRPLASGRRRTHIGRQLIAHFARTVIMAAGVHCPGIMLGTSLMHRHSAVVKRVIRLLQFSPFGGRWTQIVVQ